MASYVNNGNGNLGTYGGTNSGDIYGATNQEQSTSTKYKTVYSSENNQLKDYETTRKKNKGDAIYETSSSEFAVTGSWFEVLAEFPHGSYPFFIRGGAAGNNTITGLYCFSNCDGSDTPFSFRPVLVP